MAAMLEFAGMLFVIRQNEIRRKRKVCNNGKSLRRGSFEIKEMGTKIDVIAMLLFVFAYIVFNITYWINLLVQL